MKVIFLDIDGLLILYWIIVVNGGIFKIIDGVECRFFDEIVFKFLSGIVRISKVVIIIFFIWRDLLCFDWMVNNFGFFIVGRFNLVVDFVFKCGEEIK